MSLLLALARFGGEVAHKMLVGVSQEVVALGSVPPEVDAFEDGHQLGEPVHHLLALAELLLVVEVREIDGSLQLFVGVRQASYDLIDFIADLLVVLGGDHVCESATCRNREKGTRITSVAVRNVLHEQENENVVFILRGVHSTPEFVADCQREE